MKHGTNFALALLLLAANSAFALTPGEQTALSNLVVQAKSQGMTDSVVIYKWLVVGTQTGTTTTTNIFTRDRLIVAVENQLESIRTEYGIATTNTWADTTAIFTAAYATNTGTTAASIVSRDRISQDRAIFATCLATLRTLSVTAAANSTNIITTPVFTPNWTNATAITVTDVESVMR